MFRPLGRVDLSGFGSLLRKALASINSKRSQFATHLSDCHGGNGGRIVVHSKQRKHIHMGRVSAYEFESMGDETTRNRRLVRHIAVLCHACATGFLFLYFVSIGLDGYCIPYYCLLYLAVLYLGLVLVIVVLIVEILFDHYLIVPLVLCAPSDLYKLRA